MPFTKTWYQTHEHPKGMLGKSHSPETKARMSEIGKKKKLSQDWKQKIALSRLGKKHSQETKEKISKTKNLKISLGIIKSEHRVGPNNNFWAGDAVGYWALHSWVRRWKGKAKICVECESTRYCDWANISGEYKRDLSDYKSLCRKCHKAFDRRKN